MQGAQDWTARAGQALVSGTPRLPWGIIGGTGLTALEDFVVLDRETPVTPYGTPSAALTRGRLGSVPAVFLPRHGADHTLAPHCINYRANIWALARAAERVVAVAAVGGINRHMAPGDVVIVDQLIDYTWGRAHTFSDAQAEQVLHVDFTEPYDAGVRGALLQAALRAGVEVHDGGTYAATQGPRLESAAEVERLARDGCDVVGMTGMPEAGLAREQALPYACCAVVVNAAAGRAGGPITMDMIRANLQVGMRRVLALLRALEWPPASD